jgi:tetratricopeptide (TPR) repeat protein
MTLASKTRQSLAILGIAAILSSASLFSLAQDQPAPAPANSAPANVPPSVAAAPQEASTPSPTDTELDAGLKYLKANQPEKALAEFQRVLQTDPDNATANLLAASSALNLYMADVAVTYAEKARQLAPDDWRVDTTLVTAYAAAGKSEQRDAVRAKLVALHASPNAPDAMKANGFLLDLFKVGKYRVEVVQYFQPIGKFHTYYRFLIRNLGGRRVWEYDLQSDDFTQKSWAEAHPQEAAAGGRQYSLESDTGDTHTEYRLFSGNPPYDDVRAVVVRLLQERTTPFPSEVPKPAPAVQ